MANVIYHQVDCVEKSYEPIFCVFLFFFSPIRTHIESGFFLFVFLHPLYVLFFFNSTTIYLLSTYRVHSCEKRVLFIQFFALMVDFFVCFLFNLPPFLVCVYFGCKFKSAAATRVCVNVISL